MPEDPKSSPILISSNLSGIEKYRKYARLLRRRYVVSKAVDGNALRCIQFILGKMKPDVETLKWLKNRLSAENQTSTLPAGALEMDFELTVQSLRKKIGTILKDESFLNDENSKEKLISLAKKPYADFLDSAIRTMKSEMTYEQKYEKISHLTNELKEQYDGSSAAFKMEVLAYPEKMLTFSIVMACTKAVLSSYPLHVRNNTNLNALIAAIEIYLIVARTGQLPESLPDGLPKDPYTGKDFEYRITDEGFVLGFDPENIDNLRIRQFEFKVKK